MEWTTKLTFSNMEDYKEFVREMRVRYNIPRRVGNREILPDEGRSRRGGSVSINAINCNNNNDDFLFKQICDFLTNKEKIKEIYNRDVQDFNIKGHTLEVTIDYGNMVEVTVENGTYIMQNCIPYGLTRHDDIIYDYDLDEPYKGNTFQQFVDDFTELHYYCLFGYHDMDEVYRDAYEAQQRYEDEIDITGSKSLTSSGGYGYPYLSIRQEIANRLIDLAHSVNSSYSFINECVGDQGQLIYDIVHAGVVIGTFEVFTDCPYNSPYRYFFHHKRRPNGEWQGMNQDELKKDFENFTWFNDGHPVHS